MDLRWMMVTLQPEWVWDERSGSWELYSLTEVS